MLYQVQETVAVTGTGWYYAKSVPRILEGRYERAELISAYLNQSTGTFDFDGIALEDGLGNRSFLNYSATPFVTYVLRLEKWIDLPSETRVAFRVATHAVNGNLTYSLLVNRLK